MSKGLDLIELPTVCDHRTLGPDTRSRNFLSVPADLSDLMVFRGSCDRVFRIGRVFDAHVVRITLYAGSVRFGVNNPLYRRCVGKSSSESSGEPSSESSCKSSCKSSCISSYKQSCMFSRIFSRHRQRAPASTRRDALRRNYGDSTFELHSSARHVCFGRSLSPRYWRFLF